MFAKSRMVSVAGRRRKTCRNSTGVRRMYSPFGTPAGKSAPLRNPPGPSFLTAAPDVEEEHPQREDQREPDDRRARDVEERHDTGDVEEEDREEDRRDDRRVLVAELLTESLDRDLAAAEVQHHLDDDLEPSRDELGATGGEHDEKHRHGGRDEADDHDAVDLERGALERDRGREEVRQRRRVEAALAVFRGEREDRRKAEQGGLLRSRVSPARFGAGTLATLGRRVCGGKPNL